MKRLFLFALLILICACSREPAELPPAKAIQGRWECDFERTWKQSKSRFIADLYRGSRANGPEAAQREKRVRRELQDRLSGLSIEFREGGRFSIQAQSQSLTGSYKIVKTTADGVIVHLELTGVPAKGEPFGFEVKIQSADRLQLKELGTGRSAPQYIMHRA